MDGCVPNTKVWIGIVMSFDHFAVNDFVLFGLVVVSLVFILGWLLSNDEDRGKEEVDIVWIDGVDEEN